MTTRAVEQFDEWESSPFRDGYRGLHDLAEGEFSGIVEASGAKLCMLNGTVVGILGGDIDSFEDASGTAYEAPTPALPLLALMQERNDEVRAKYYSEDTPLTEVDDTLSDGGFTGFVELSENVLSGDYYVVYHRGRSMAVAWVGNSGQLLTDDEAFDRADDEVGIFQVRPAEIEPVEIPEVESDDADGPDAAADSDVPSGAAGEGGEVDTTEADSAATDDATAADPTDADRATAADESGETTTADAGAPPDADEVDSRSEADPSVESARDESAGTRESDTASAASAHERDDAVETEPDDSPSGAAEDRSADDAAAGAGRSEPSPDADEGRATGRDTGDATGSTARRDESGDTSADVRTDRSTETDRSDSSTGAGRERSERTTETDRDRSAETERSRTDRATETDHNGADQRDSRRTADARSAEPDRESAPDREATTERTGSPTEPRGRTSEANGRAEEPAASNRSADAGTSGASAGSAGTPDQLATHSIPSLDPDRTTAPKSAEDSPSPAPAADEPPARENTTAAPSTEERPAGSANGPAEPSGGRQNGRPADRDQSSADPATDESSDARSERASGESRPAEATGEPSSARVADLEAELEEREAEIERLEAELATAETERDDLRAELEAVRTERDDLQSRIDPLEDERDDLAAEVDDLQAEVERLETQIEDIEAEFGDAVDAERRMSPGEALDQTNLFVRYESKGQATLETAHAGDATRQEVGENLGLEYHTQFDRDSVSVGGRPFDEFLRETIQFQFVTWVINDLLYEIRDTGKVAELQALYDAIPQIDRAELNGVVSTEYTEDGQERRSQESFDVVMRDRMGNPLLTANMNDSRQAASESMMSALVTASSHVGESTETLGASFLVTSSFFEPEALETAAEATSGGLLSRDKRESFVKLSRKQGYHLCLVEAREDKFHLAVPEL